MNYHMIQEKYNIENVREFYGDVCELIKQIKDTIWTEENDLWLRRAFMENLFTHFDLTEFPQIDRKEEIIETQKSKKY